MSGKSNLLLLSAAASCLFFALPAQAAQVDAVYGKMYMGASAGIVIPDDITVSGSYNGTSGSGKFEFSTGYQASIHVGYTFNDYLRAEVEGTYASVDYDKLSGSITHNGTTYSGSVDLKGSVDTWMGLANVIVTPLGKTKFSPYIGGGLGIAHYDDSISRIQNTAVDVSETKDNLALQGIVGIDYAVTDVLNVGLRYRYVWINSGGSGIDDFTSSVVSLTGTYRF